MHEPEPSGTEPLQGTAAAPEGAAAPPQGGHEGTSIEAQLAALRADVAALRDLLRVGRASGGASPDQHPPASSTPQQAEVTRRMSDELIRRNDELEQARRELAQTQRRLQTAELQRKQLLASRTWRWGKVVSRLGMAPVTMARKVYSSLLRHLPYPAAAALRRFVATAKGSPPPTGGPRPAGPGAPRPTMPAATSGPAPLVPIPALGLMDAGEPLAPSVLLVADGIDADTLTGLVKEIEVLSHDLPGLRVLFVTDCDAFHVFRSRSMLFEYVPRRTHWEMHGFERSYDDFRAARMAELVSVYAPDRIVHVKSVDDLRGLPATLFAAA